MALWIVFAVLTALAAMAVLRPYLRPRNDGPAAGPRDIDIYKEQLREIEGEHARGVLGDAEAQAARIEVSRRILALADEKTAAKGGKTAPVASVPYAMAGFMAAAALVLYLMYGSPTMPGQPLATREGPTVESAIAGMEKELRKRPDDVRGWMVASTLYMRAGRFKDADAAFTKLIQLNGERPEWLSGRAEALIFANQGAVSPEARALLEKALAQEANGIKTNFWLGMSDEQAGKYADAANRYRKLLESDAPEQVKGALRERLASLEQKAAGAPSKDASASEDALIERMVTRLADRLKADGSDLSGWLKLVKAYMVMGRRDDATTALKDARRNFTGNADALTQLDALAKSLGLAS